jgi:hypothetical protein
LALFVAGRSPLALYREFVFPSVPARTGLLAATLEDVRASSPENTPLALDIALSRSAVVVYDRGGKSRLPLDYVHALREDRPVVVVEAPTRDGDLAAGAAPAGDGGTSVRPSEMIGWEGFAESLLAHIDRAAIRPGAAQIDAELTRLSEREQWTDLLLTALALLLRQVRRPDGNGPPVQGPPADPALSPSDPGVARLRAHFGTDYPQVLDAVSVRHDLLQDLEPHPVELRRVADDVARIARQRYGLPPRVSGATGGGMPPPSYP